MYDLVVLGGGSGGLNVAAMAARVGAKVALIEKHQLGGECTHTACVPSKALIRAARLVDDIRKAKSFGVDVAAPKLDFAAVIGRIRSVIAEFTAEETAGSLAEKGIDVLFGSPAFEAYDTVLLDGRTRVVSQKFVLATGSSPAIPPIPGLAAAGYLDNTTIWDLEALPASVAVLGAGPVGLEIGQALARFGSKVTVLADSDRVLPAEDPEVSESVRSALEADGVAFRLGIEVNEVRVADGRKEIFLTGRGGGASSSLRADALLVAAGRRPNLEGLDLEAAGIHLDRDGWVEVNASLQTTNPRVYAIGDVIGHHLWTHAAEREAVVAFQNAVLRLPKKVDYAAMPWATFVDPEVATVGLTAAAALDVEPDARFFRVEFRSVDRARIDGRPEGFAKVVASPSGRILGATIVGEEASLLLQEFVVAMENGLTLGDLLETVHIYPSYATLVRGLAAQFAATRLEGGLVQRALRWFYGFQPRTSRDPEASRQDEDEALASSHASTNGH